MPRFDGAGPHGQGAMTGRGMGNCKQGRGCERGRGLGQGLGRGQGEPCRFADSGKDLTLQERLELLKANKKRLELEIELLEKEQS
ncbi:MAG: DUF5320 domain-containing protein [bacterium]